MPPIVDLNGELVRADAAEVSVSDLGVLYGIGLFETMRSYAGRVFRFRQHVDRLLASAEKLKLPFRREMLPDEGRIVALLEANDLTDARLRLTVSGGSPAEEGLKHMVLTTAVPLEPVPDEYHTRGVTVHVASPVQHSTDPLIGHKTTCYWPRLQALHEAQQRGCAEALWFTETRKLAEGSISNVFLIKDGTAKTPPLNTPVLPGVTRAAVIELCERANIPCLQSPLTIDDLLDADEAFLCNCIMEIVPVCRVERSAIGDEKVGPITTKLTDAYRTLTEETSTA
jgi:branched-subunit amino acid aminotransferase/4-amino-4-deoxychorismate lyase